MRIIYCGIKPCYFVFNNKHHITFLSTRFHNILSIQHICNLHRVQETFYFPIFFIRYCALTVRSPCVHLLSPLLSRSLFTKRSLCAHRSFSVYLVSQIILNLGWLQYINVVYLLFFFLLPTNRSKIYPRGPPNKSFTYRLHIVHLALTDHLVLSCIACTSNTFAIHT